MSNKLVTWFIFIALCIIWGSSFILMKIGLYDSANRPLLTAFQVAAMRIFSAGVILFPFVIKQWKKIPFHLAGRIILSGLIGSFIPAFLFCIAETKIDSGLAGVLNALTPMFVILAGFFIYGKKVPHNKIIGIILGLIGSVLLFLNQERHGMGELGYAGYIILATILYGVNVNMVQQKLAHVPSIVIVSFAFSALIIPSAAILWFTGYFRLPLSTTPYLIATAASSLLGIMGTAVASIIFYMLLKRGGPVFASLVTYGIPFVALGWGLVYKETVTWGQIASLLIILAGVYVANIDWSYWKTKRMKAKE